MPRSRVRGFASWSWRSCAGGRRAAAPGTALRRALRGMPRRRSPGRDGARAAAREPGAVAATGGGAGHPPGAACDADAGLFGQARRGGGASTRGIHLRAARGGARMGRGANPRFAHRARENGQPSPQAASTTPIRSTSSWSWKPATTTSPSSTATALSRIHRFPSRFALHGGPKFTPDGRYVFFASRDGWISKFDLWSLQTRGRGPRRASIRAMSRSPATAAG